MQVRLFCEGKWQLTFIYTETCLTKYHFLVDPFVVTNQANLSRLLGTFITEVGIALVEVTLKLQGLFLYPRNALVL